MSLMGGREKIERERPIEWAGRLLSSVLFLFHYVLSHNQKQLYFHPPFLSSAFIEHLLVSEPDIVKGAKDISMNRLDGGTT